jgi:hypothetical protein
MSTANIAPLPVCKAILLCQHVDADEPGRLNLTGVVSNMFVGPLLVAPPIELFCQITDAIGRYRLVVEIHDLEANEIVGRSEPTEFEAIDPTMNLDVIMSVAGIEFRRTGLHDIVVFANGEEIDRKQFGVAFREDAEHVIAT